MERPVRLQVLVQNLSKPSCRFRVLELLPELDARGIKGAVAVIPPDRGPRAALLEASADFDATILARKLLVGADLKTLRRAARKLV